MRYGTTPEGIFGPGPGLPGGIRSPIRMMRFFGPALLIGVGYMDPGNWATDLAGGSQYGYTLMWVILASSIIAVGLQILCVRLGVASGRDLAQLCREAFPKPVAIALWVLAELAIVATDVAEVIGSAVGLKLLFGLPLAIGVLVTGLDVLLLLALIKKGMRAMEALIGGLVGIIAMSFLVQLILARPDVGQAVAALVPREPLKGDALLIAVGIIGATVMPHNLYLHTSIVRKGPPGEEGAAIRGGTWDTIIALSAAFFVNAAILILAARVFFPNKVEDLEVAHKLLGPLLGSAAPILFGVGLLAAGQSSTITGTLAGQIVMEGFTTWKVNPVLRRLAVRLLALVPAMLLVTVLEGGSVDGLTISQVILSLQLPFAVFPLLWLASRRDLMGKYASPLWMTILGGMAGALITVLNLILLYGVFFPARRPDATPPVAAVSQAAIPARKVTPISAPLSP